MPDPNYDELVAAWRTATRRVLAAGSDDIILTGDDLRDMLENMIEEEDA